MTPHTDPNEGRLRDSHSAASNASLAPHVSDSSVSSPWTVLLIGGNSGAGKSTIARQIGLRFGIPWLEVDDFRLAMQRVTMPEQIPELHTFLERDVWGMSPKDMCDGLIAVGTAVSRALEVVVAHHINTRRPVVLEGDGIVPSMASQRTFASMERGDDVRTVFLIESDEEVLVRNSLETAASRKADPPPVDEMRKHLAMSHLYGRWLQEEAIRLGLPVVDSQPRETVVERVLQAASR